MSGEAGHKYAPFVTWLSFLANAVGRSRGCAGKTATFPSVVFTND